jgi:hypothetical protein
MKNKIKTLSFRQKILKLSLLLTNSKSTSMIKIIILFFGFCYVSCFSQDTTEIFKIKLDSIKKTKYIFSNISETSSSSSKNSIKAGTSGNSIGDKTLAGGSARGISIAFTVGTDGYFQGLGRNSKNLKEAIKTDPEALAELIKANMHLKKKKMYHTLEYFSYALTVGAAISLFIGLDDYKEVGVSGPLVAGSIGVAGGFSSIIIFKKKTDKHMDAWEEHIKKSIEIYNQNLITKIKFKK